MLICNIKNLIIICLISTASLLPLIESCYRPWDDEWEWFEYARRYRGVCRIKGSGCADACRSDGKTGGRCVLTGYFFWSCACMCYREGYPVDRTKIKNPEKIMYIVVKDDKHLSSVPSASSVRPATVSHSNHFSIDSA